MLPLYEKKQSQTAFLNPGTGEIFTKISNKKFFFSKKISQPISAIFTGAFVKTCNQKRWTP